MIRTLLPLAGAAALRGRDARIRTALVAIAAGFAVALLLLAVSVPGALAARSARSDARSPLRTDTAAPLRLAEIGITGSTDDVSGLVIAPPAGPAPLPPGIPSLPPAGTMLVSPALLADLAGADGALLHARLPYRIVGTIGSAGLLGPTEARFIAVDPAMAGAGTAVAVRGFGETGNPEPLDPVLTLLVVVGVLILLVPIGIVVAVAGRFGAERRDRRLAALRLLGLSSGSVLALALLEAAVAAALGDLVGLAVFAGARSVIGSFSIASLSVFPGDVAPPWPAVALVLAVVPILLGGAALAGLLALRVEPLGVVRRAARHRRLAWRMVALGLAAALLAGGGVALAARLGVGVWLVGAGVVLLLGAAVALLPWITERIAGALAIGPVSWQVALKRIRHDGTTTGRVVGAITAVVAGAIALQLLLAGLAGTYTTDTGVRVSGTLLTAQLQGAATAERMRTVLAAGGATFATTDLGVRGHDGRFVTVVTGDCAALASVASVPGCADGRVFVSPGGSARRGTVLDAHGAWRVPGDAATTTLTALPDGDTFEGALLVTPGALPLARQAPVSVSSVVPDGSAALLRIVLAATAVDPTIAVRPLAPISVSHRFDAVRRGLTAGLVLVLLLIGLVLLVSVGEQLRERRRALAVLAVLGLPRGTLARSILAESALPVVVGGVVAAVAGAALGTALLAILGRPGFPDAAVVASTAAVALIVPVLVTVAGLPAALRLLRPEHLRAE
ncbi:MAG TPA: FtsX-like permease family protein [Amnibacterium sp.]|nr:FtsX-like permease family protein [Amnibacterium sp.]